MAIYEVTITTVPILLATLAVGPLRLFGLLPHRTSRKARRRDLVTDRDTLRYLAAVFVFAVFGLTFELHHVGYRFVAATCLAIAGCLVFAAVWRYAEASYRPEPVERAA